MTNPFNQPGGRSRWRRHAGIMVVTTMWLKLLVVALGMAQPVQAGHQDTAEGGGPSGLLAALAVICTPNGTKKLGGQDESRAQPGLADCLLCSSCQGVSPTCLHGDAAYHSGALDRIVFETRQTPAFGGFDHRAAPRAPPSLIFS